MGPFYYYLWGLYGVAALGFLFLGWRLCRCIKSPVLAFSFFALILAVLFTPVKVLPDQMDWGPALVVASLDAFTQGWSGAWSGIKFIIMVYAGLLVLAVPAGVWRSKTVKRASAEAADSQ